MKKNLFAIIMTFLVFGILNASGSPSPKTPYVSDVIDVTSYARYPQGLDALRLDPTAIGHSVVENAVFNPMVIANKRDKNNLFIVCSQGDAFAGFLTDLALFTLDGGRTWNQSDLITSRIQGATNPGAPDDFVSATDPFAASDKYGNLHFIYAAIQHFNPDGSFNPGNAANYTKSSDKGIGWNVIDSISNNLNPPVQFFVDRPTITVNPYHQKHLYAVWGNLQSELDPSLSQTFELQISKDSGNTWSSPTTIITLDPGVYGFNAILHILPDQSGVLIYQNNNPDGTLDIVVLKTTDFVNWTKYYAYQGGTITTVFDPNDPNLIYQTYVLGVDSKIFQKTGELYITWEDANANPNSTPTMPAAGAFVSRSADGGTTWSTPVVINPTTLGVQTFSPTIALTKNGAVGIAFYDFRNYQNAGNFTDSLSTDLWLSIFSHKLKHLLSQPRLTPESFDARKFTFSNNEGWEISDFGTIGSVENDFLIAYPTTNPPFGGGPVVRTPGEIDNGLQVTLKFIRVFAG